MIEIVFGESACGSLKIAQTYGKGKYRGSAVSIFMRHEDGSVPSSDEMKKAQLQAQEQERIAWENAIPLGGKSSDVYCFDMVNEARFSNIFIEKRASTCPQSLEKSRLFSYALLVSECENFQNMKRIFLRKVVI